MGQAFRRDLMAKNFVRYCYPAATLTAAAAVNDNREGLGEGNGGYGGGGV